MRRFTANDVACTRCGKTIPHNTLLEEYEAPNGGTYRLCLPCGRAFTKYARSPIVVKVTFDDGDYLTTRINATLAEAEKHYLGVRFNLGVMEDRMVTAVKVELAGKGSDS